MFKSLAQRRNDFWQVYVTSIYIAIYGRWYTPTVIDTYSRYLLACHLTHSNSASPEPARALTLGRREGASWADPPAVSDGRQRLVVIGLTMFGSHTRLPCTAFCFQRSLNATLS